MGIININQFQIIAFSLVLLRCIGFFISWPIFNGQNVPVSLKVLLSLLVAIICFSIVPETAYPKVTSYQALIILSAKEMLIGFTIGFIATFFFHTVSIAGELISMAMGLSSAQIFNPALNMQQSAVNQLYFFLAAFLFLAIRGHHYFIIGLTESFQLVPLNVVLPRMSHLGEFSLLGKKIIEVGLLLSAPVLVSILLVNISLGIMGRAVPQINVLITSLPVNALLGLSVLIIMLPFFIDAMRAEIGEFSQIVFNFLRAF